MNGPSDDPVTFSTVLGWAGAALSALLAGIVGLFSRTNSTEHSNLAKMLEDHEKRLRAHASEINDAQVTADYAKHLFTSAVETSHIFHQKTITELTAAIELHSEKTRAALELHAANTERKIDAVNARLANAGLRRPYQDDGA